MVTVKRAPAAAAALLILAAAAFLAVPPLDRAAREGVDAAVKSARYGLEELIGLRISFDSLSPSILRSASVSRLRVSAPDGRSLLEAKRVLVYYNMLALLTGDASRAVTGLGLEGARLDLRLPDDRALVDRLSRLLSGKGGGPTPRIVVTGRDVEVGVEMSGIGRADFTASDLRFSTMEEEVGLSLDGKFSIRGEGASSREISGPVGVSGSLSRDFSRARLGLSIAAASEGLSIATQRFELVYADGSMSLTKIKDKAPIDAELRYDIASRDLSVSIRMEGFAPSSSLRLGKGYEAVEPWLAIPYRGTISLEVPGGDIRAVAYEARVSGSLPSMLFPRGSGIGGPAEAELEAKGDYSSASIELARLDSPGLTLEYRGAFRFADLSPDGTLYAKVALLGGRLPVEASLQVAERDGEYSAVADSASAAGVEIRDIVVLAERKGGSIDFRASLRPPEAETEDAPTSRFTGEAGTGGGRLPSIALEGSASIGKEPGLEISVDVGELDLGPIKPIIAAATGSPEAAALAGDFKVGFELFATSDFKRLSWSAPEFTIVSRRSPGTFASLSLAGSDKSLSVKSAVLSLGGYAVKGSGKLDFGGTEGLGFEARISLSDIPYVVRGSLAGGGLSMTGDYGLELSATKAGEDTYFDASAIGLPLPVAGDVFLATLGATGRFRSAEDWSVSLSRLELAPAGERAADLPKVELEGSLGPTRGEFRSVRVSDKTSTLSGNASISYSFGGGFRASLDADLEGKPQRASDKAVESYTIAAAYESGRYSGKIAVVASPTARLRGLPVSGSIDGDATFSGDLENPSVDFRARLRDGAFQEQALGLSVAGSYSGGRVAVTSLDAAYQGFRVSEAKGGLSFDSGKGDLSALVSGSFLDEPFSYAVSASGESTSPGGQADPFNGYSIKGSARSGKAGSASWPFSARLEGGGLSLRAGGSDELRIDYRPDRSFSASLRDPLPVRVEATGKLDGKNIELSAKGLDFDASFLQPLMSPKDLSFDSGRVRGSFRAYGLAADPEIEGELQIVNAMLRVPGWVADPIGPINVPVSMSERGFSAIAHSVPVGRAAVTARAQGVFDHWLPSQLSASISSIAGSRVQLAFVVLGIKAQGEAEIDLKGSLEGDVFRFDVDAAFDKASVVVSPETLGGGSASDSAPHERPSVTLDLTANLRFGRGVKVYFPYKDNPVVEGYTEPSSALLIKWDQASGDYAVKGTAAMRGGEVFYIQRNFFLKSGKMVFNEGTGMFDPRVTILAELRERNDEGPVLVTLRADNAPISSFKPRLSSDPPMTESQIAILLGQNLLGASSDKSLDIRKAVISSSEFIPQLNVAKAFENKAREMAGLDILFLRTQVLQRWLIDISGDTEAKAGNPLSRYLDSSELYAGKYLSDSIFAYGSARLREDPLAGSDRLRIDSEFGVELDTPFGLVQWTIAPSHWDDLLISDQSLSLSWRLSY
jgi:translocation and assembly module TamB